MERVKESFRPQSGGTGESCSKAYFALAAFITFLLAVMLLPGQAQAFTGSGGDGSQEDPWQISTAADLIELSDEVYDDGESSYEQYYVMTNDIDLTGSGFKPIGYYGSSYSFMGHFDGAGYAVTMDMTSDKKYVGLFGQISGESTEDRASVSNVTVKGTIKDTRNREYEYFSNEYGVGAIVGTAQNVDLTNCVNEAAVTGGASVGGIVGYMKSASTVKMDGCENRGTITLDQVTDSGYNGVAGGLVGYMPTGKYAASDGDAAYEYSMTNCYNRGAVTNTTELTTAYLGGLVGYFALPTSGSQAGILSLSNSYSTGAVTGSTITGGLFGYCGDVDYPALKPNVTVTNCYALDGSASVLYPAGAEEGITFDTASAFKTDAEMKSKDFALAMGSAFTAQAGDYPVFVRENVFGVPVITTQPEGYSVTVGQPSTALTIVAELPEDAVEGSVLSYQWYSCTDSSGSDAAAITGATSASYTPAAKTSFAESYFYCVVTNSWVEEGNNASQAAKSQVVDVVTVSATPAAAPTISTQPTNTVYEVKSTTGTPLSVTAEVSGEGAGTLSYQWYSTPDGTVAAGTAITNATSASYSPDTSTLGDSYYYCVITNTFEQSKTAQATSDVAKATVEGIKINTADDLKSLADKVYSGKTQVGLTYELTADIDLTTLSSWRPIGGDYSSDYFAGVFDGKGHTITMGGSSSWAGVGLFGYVKGTATQHAVIKNVNVVGSVTSTSTSSSRSGGTGAIVGVGSFCDIIDCSNAATVSGGVCVGGIIGSTNLSKSSVTITGCANRGEVIASKSTSSASAVGGIAGYTKPAETAGDDTLIKNCYNVGAVKITSGATSGSVGGLVGIMALPYSATDGAQKIENCYNTGSLSGDAGVTFGGVVGSCGDNLAAAAPQCSVITNAHSLDTAATDLYPSAAEGSLTATGCTFETDAAMRTKTFATTLGSGFVYMGGNYPPLPREYVMGTPSISSQPQDVVCELNETGVSLSVSAELPDESQATGALSYQWYSNTTGVVDEGDTAIFGATNSSYSPAVDSVNTVYYYVKVTDDWTNGESPESVSVYSKVARVVVTSDKEAVAPTITTQPADATYEQFATAAELSVDASVTGEGAGTLSYQWFASDSDSNEDGQIIPGADQSSYAPGTAEVGSRYYYCTVTNTFETVKTNQVSTRAAKIDVTAQQITSADDLAALAASVEDGTAVEGQVYELANDIDLSAYPDWAGIGTTKYKNFKGVLDGKNHAITGLNINKPSTGSQALFGYISNATIKNLNVFGKVTGANVSAGVVATASGNCSLENVSSYVDVTGGSESAGLVADTASGASVKFTNCANHGSITAASSGYYAYVGGICSFGNNCTFTNCYNAGTVSFSGTSTNIIIGGITCTGTSGVATFTNCYNSGAINSTGGSVGAITGLLTAVGDSSANNYYDQETSVVKGTADADDPASITAKTTAEMTAPTMVAALNGESGTAYREDTANTNGGYPLLSEEGNLGLPVITASELADAQYVQNGSPVTALSVTAALPSTGLVGSDGTLSYQWYANTSDVIDLAEVKKVASATETTYTPSVENIGKTYYYCKVTNSFDGKEVSTVSDTASVFVYSAIAASMPTIVTQPASATYPEGVATGSLVVNAQVSGAGAGTLTYQWFSNTTNSTTGGTAIPDETSYKLDLPAQDVGTYYYYCEVTNTFETVKTAKAKTNVASIKVEPYVISTPEQLSQLAQYVAAGNDFAGITIKLDADLNMTDTAMSPIGTYDSTNYDKNPFSGTFEGQGHSINGINITCSDPENGERVGLFGYTTNATISDLTLSGSVKGIGSVGSAVGYAENTLVTGVVSSVDVTATEDRAGGICGETFAVTGDFDYGVKDCANSGKVVAEGNLAGGLVGNLAGGDIKDCYNRGEVTAENKAGGICGYMFDGTITYCYNSAVVTAENTTASPVLAGGILGMQPGGFVDDVPGSLHDTYYDSDITSVGVPVTSEDTLANLDEDYDVLAIATPGDTMKTDEFAAKLGDGFAPDTTNLNGGFPILKDQSQDWDGTAVDTSWFNSGETNFVISTPAQLAGVAKLVNDGVTDFSGKKVSLANDIVLNSEAVSGHNTLANNWTPIGNMSMQFDTGYAFKGTFDGQGHTVRNMYAYDLGVANGLFGTIDRGARILNVGVTGYSYTSNYFAGGIVGRVANVASGTDPVIDRCWNGAKVESDTGKATRGCGGIVGGDIGGDASASIIRYTISNCYNTGTIHSVSKTAGGVAGVCSGTIENCFNVGSVTSGASSDTYAGSITGNNFHGTVVNSYFLEGTATKGVAFEEYPQLTEVTSCNEATMKGVTTLAALGEAFCEDRGTINNGYPILQYQLTTTATDLSGFTVDAIADQTYTGSALTPAVSVLNGTDALVSGVDYELTYVDNVNVGTAKVYIAGKGAYIGVAQTSFKIVAAPVDISTGTIAPIPDQTYSGSAVKPAVTVTVDGKTLSLGTDYTVEYTNNDAVGTANVAVTGIGSYKGTLASTFKIVAGEVTPPTPTDISTGVITSIPAQVFDGSEVKPEVTVTVDEKTLVEGVDFTVEYANNDAIGTATVTVTGIGDYAGTLTSSFEITAAEFGFPDVDEEIAANGADNVWYVAGDYLDYVVDRGIMSGYTAGDKKGWFGPYDSITRGQVVTVLYRCATGKTADDTDNAVETSFNDVPFDEYYTAAVKWASDNGIVTGYTDDAGNSLGIFKPNNNVTREELATMIARFGAYNGEVIAGADSTKFDSLEGHEQVADYARESMIWCCDKGIISGVEDKATHTFSLNPQDTAWRSSMAKMTTVLLRDILLIG